MIETTLLPPYRLAHRTSFVRWALPIVVAAMLGCGDSSHPKTEPSTDENQVESADPLTVIVLDDQPLGEAIERQWSAHSNADVTIRHMSSRDFVSAKDRPDGDVIIYPAGLLGELVEGDVIRPVPNQVLDHPSVDWRDVLAFDRGANVSWDKKVYAFSFGSPSLVLFYRSDIFAALKLEVPRTWKEYGEVAKKLHARESLGELAPAGDAPWSATAEPLALGWAGETLLARAAAYACHPSRYSTLFNYISMEPLIDRKPYIEALDELAAAKAFGPANHKELTPDGARRAILEGRCAMAISWPTNDRDDVGADHTTKTLPISFAPLPGSDVTFNFADDKWEKRKGDDLHVPLLGVSGRLGSIFKDASNVRGALNMLARLTSKDLGQTVASRSQHTTMFRASQMARPEDWVNGAIDSPAAQQYALTWQHHQGRTMWLFSLRIPGRLQYLDALDEAVGRVLVDGQSSADALSAAAKRWRDITSSEGRTVESQRQAYEKSLGL